MNGIDRPQSEPSVPSWASSSKKCTPNATVSARVAMTRLDGWRRTYGLYACICGTSFQETFVLTGLGPAYWPPSDPAMLDLSSGGQVVALPCGLHCSCG